MKLPLRSNGALNTALLKKMETELRCGSATSLPHLAQLPLQQLAWHLHHLVAEVPACACGKPRLFKGFGKGYTAACKTTCFGKQRSAELKMLERYGVANSFQLEKSKQNGIATSQKRYGKDHFSQTAEFIKGAIETNQKNLGVDWPTQSDVITTKRRLQNNKKYGVNDPLQLPVVQAKLIQTNIQRYGVSWPTQNKLTVKKGQLTRKKTEDLKNPNRLKLNDPEAVLARYGELKNLTTLSTELGLHVNFVSRWFKNNGFAVDKKSRASSIEIELFEWLEGAGFEPRLHDRDLIKPYEIDVVVNNLGIEVNGIYWHSFDAVETTEEKRRHLRKLEMAELAGVGLFQFTDLEWNSRKDIIKSIILHRLGQSTPIYARKTQVKELKNSDVKEFFNLNHLQGHVPASVNLGLFLRDELVAVMNFSKPRFNKNYPWELIRYAGKKFHNVVGGAEKLLKAFQTMHVGPILSYSDRMKFTGALYERLGFVKSHVNPPAYHYTDRKQLMSRVKFQKHKLSKVLKIFDPSLSEAENCFNNKLRRYWDCGTIAWALKLNLGAGS